MTRREYKRTAEAVKRSGLTNLARITIAEDLAEAYAKADKSFDRVAFLEWAGVHP